MSLRGFRYQTGECNELADVLKKERIAQADIDLEDELSIYFEDLPEYGVYRIEDAEFDTEALDREENPEFFGRALFSEKQGVSIKGLTENEIMKLDIFLIEEEEESYDDISLG